jgi:hypothetical protein
MIDLSRFLPASRSGDATVAALTQAELELMHMMIDQGVYVAPGTSYAMQKPGHFRLTFSLKREALVVGSVHSHLWDPRKHPLTLGFGTDWLAPAGNRAGTGAQLGPGQPVTDSPRALDQSCNRSDSVIANVRGIQEE